MVGEAGEHVAQVALRIETVEFRGADQAVEGGGALPARIGAGKEVVLAFMRTFPFRLRKSFRSRKNSLFYKTTNGAEVGDLFMRLIYTCELNDANPFDYLTELQKHAEELAQNLTVWMPWNYRQTLPQATTHEDSA